MSFVSRSFSILKSEQVQNKGQNQENSSDDLGELDQLSFFACGLRLGQEALRRTSNGAGHTVLAGLQHNDGNQSNSAQNLNNSEDDVQNSHNSSKRQLTTVIPANGKP